MSQTKAQLIDNLVQPITGALGSASAPTFSFTADPNTGLFSPGADQLSLSTGGTGRLFINSTGQTSLGTASALSGATLTIAGNCLAITGQNLAHSANSLRMGEEGSGLAELRAYGPDVSTAGSFRFRVSRSDGSNSSDIVIDSSGRLGIGNSSPGANLHVGGGSGEGLGVLLSRGATTNFFEAHDGTKTFIGGTDNTNAFVKVGSLSNHPVAIIQGNGTAIHINTSKRVGIGTDSPNAKLTITETANANAIVIRNADTNGSTLQFGINTAIPAAFIQSTKDGSGTAQPLAFFNAIAEVARFDTSGRLLVGTSSSTADAIAVFLGRTGALGGTGGEIKLAHPTTNVPANGTLGRIQFGNTGDDRGVEIAAIANQNWTSTAKGSFLTFSTTKDGQSSPTEAMRITQAGKLILNDISTVASARFGITADLNNDNGLLIKNSVTQGAGQNFVVFSNSAGNTAGTITHNGTTTVNYATSSDYRLKENVVAVIDGITRLQQLKPSRFNFIADPDKTVDGFIAHEVQDVVPEAINGTKDEVDADGNPRYQGIDQSKLVPLLTAALQEAIGRIESLEAEVAALKAQ